MVFVIAAQGDLELCFKVLREHLTDQLKDGLHLVEVGDRLEGHHVHAIRLYKKL